MGIISVWGMRRYLFIYANENGQDSLDQSHLYLRERRRERKRQIVGVGGRRERKKEKLAF